MNNTEREFAIELYQKVKHEFERRITCRIDEPLKLLQWFFIASVKVWAKVRIRSTGVIQYMKGHLEIKIIDFFIFQLS
jgi:hypothetical protein